MKKPRPPKPTRRFIELPDDPSPVLDLAGSAIVGVETILAVTTAEPVGLAVPVKARRPDCCDDNPQPPEVRILGIDTSADFATLIVDAVAIHPCGIRSVTAFVADVVVDAPGLKFIRRRVVPREVNGRRIEDPADYDCSKRFRAVAPRFRLPTADIRGSPFRIAVQAIDCCFGYDTKVSPRRLII